MTGNNSPIIRVNGDSLSGTTVLDSWASRLPSSWAPDWAAARCVRERCEVLDWAGSGAMDLTGAVDGPPDFSPAPAFAMLDEVLRVLSGVTGRIGDSVRLDAGCVLTARAAGQGFRRGGQRSAGGSTRLLRTADGWCAVTLSRAEDFEAVPAIIGAYSAVDPWKALTEHALRVSAADLADGAQLLGVPAATLASHRPTDPPLPWTMVPVAASAVPQVPCRDPAYQGVAAASLLPSIARSLHRLISATTADRRATRTGSRRSIPTAAPRSHPASAQRRRLPGLLVVDLSSMWAGPLCAHILGRAGARVVKVEGAHRLDGARADPAFFEALHAGHEFRTIDFRTASGRTELGALLEAADIVIEASRPRALAQWGFGPDVRPPRPGQIWLSLTGYGRGEPMRVAFGDDAAVAGGLVGRAGDSPVFCADAIADPLTGVCAALAICAAVESGSSGVIDLSMRAVAFAFAAARPNCTAQHEVSPHAGGWRVRCVRPGETAHDGEVLSPEAVITASGMRTIARTTTAVSGGSTC